MEQEIFRFPAPLRYDILEIELKTDITLQKYFVKGGIVDEAYWEKSSHFGSHSMDSYDFSPYRCVLFR